MLKSIKLLTAGSAAALVGLLFAVNVQAATTGHDRVIVNYTVEVTPAEQPAFEAGIKSYNQCLHQHGGKHATYAYTSVSGDLSIYQFVSDTQSWADLDAMHHETACDSTFGSILPHVAHVSKAFLVPMFSHVQKNKPFARQLVDAVAFTLKDGAAADETFKKAAKAIYAAANKSHGTYYSVTYAIVAAGSGEPADYLLVAEYGNWADFGAPPNPSLMKMLTNVYGNNKAHEIMKSLSSAIKNVTEQVYRYDASLSYTPSK